MNTLLVDGRSWRTASPRRVRGTVAPRDPRRNRLAVLTRTLGLAGLGASLCLATVTALPPPGPAAAEVGLPRDLDAPAKTDTRLATWNGPLSRLSAAAGPSAAKPLEPASSTLLDPRPADPASAGAFVVPGAPVTGSLAVDAKAFVPRPVSSMGAPVWREEEFPQVAVLDGRTLAAGETRIRLDGLELPGPDETCRTLEGRLESCAVRAQTLLDLTTRHRRVACRYRPETSTEAVGTCRIGASDLGARMLKAGYARRMGGSETVRASPPAPTASAGDRVRG